ncbi:MULTISPECIES: SWIM zinc finger family protein [unclassified Methanoregula]|uniref:SWIM zinc finger family protein n=1 Tax=unclassified Methanoregula TaxID=2649730 RepID=UPI0009C60CE3|nr:MULTISPECIES: SWIM zinc finger family protein [unclassified Methanoregula]OPX65241.1 MAG: SWIM zinc finger protein [Methanoregula sp. PtaB.Bin085]OPY32150.1 MAG: SWIM zinc finger protein [Methanoregula sp. PtaU1.Bin006]
MNDIRDLLKGRNGLDAEVRKAIEDRFGRKGKYALEAIDAGRVKKYLDFVVVEGKTSSYIVEDGFCTCGDFLYRGRACWHLLAAQIALTAGLSVPVDRWYQDMLLEPAQE